METMVINFHDSENVLDELGACAGTACWAELRDQDLFGDHRFILKQIAKTHSAHF